MAEQQPVTAAEVEALRRQLTDVRRERMAQQRATTARGPLELAISAAARDRDAGSTSQTTALSAEADRLAAAIVESCATVDRLRVNVARVRSVGFDLSDVPSWGNLQHALTAEASWRADARQELARAGVELTVPPASEPLLPPHADASELLGYYNGTRARDDAR